MASGDGVCAGAAVIETRSITPMIVRRLDIDWLLPKRSDVPPKSVLPDQAFLILDT
jgi:hypothetical protein